MLSGPLILNANYQVPANGMITLIDNDGTDAVSGTFAGLGEGATVTAGGQAFAITYKGGTGNDVVLTRTSAAAPLPQVTAVQVNGGAAQRSRVTSVAVTFNTDVTFAGAPAAAFTLTRQGGGAVGGFTATAGNADGVTTVTLSNFSGAETDPGSLADGRYTLSVLAAQVSDAAGQLDGNSDGTGGDDYQLIGSPGVAPNLFRLFGDADGNGTVNASDFLAFRLAFLQPNTTFDFDGNGTVDAGDFLQFRLRFLQSV